MTPEEEMILGGLLANTEIGIHLSSNQRHTYKTKKDGAEIEYSIKLKFPMYRENGKNARVYLKQIDFGGQGKIYSAGTVTLNSDNRAQYKQNEQHERLIKEFEREDISKAENQDWAINRLQEYTRLDIKNKKKIQEKIPYLHIKDALISNKKKNEYWIVSSMHKLPKKDLNKVISKDGKKLNAELKFEITRRFLRHLKDIHQAGVLHGDIKPMNIMVDINYQTNSVEELKLIDFDVSKLVSEPSILVTTPGYRPPNDSKVGKHSDIYSAAITLLRTWGASKKKVETPDGADIGYFEVKKFKPDINIQNRSLNKYPNVRIALNKLFAGMTASEDDRFDVDNALTEANKLELEYFLTALNLTDNDTAKQELELASSLANDLYGQLENAYNEKNNDIDSYLARLKNELNSVFDKIKNINSPFALIYFTKILGMNSLRAYDNVEDLRVAVENNLKLFKENFQHLKSLGDDKDRLYKKIIKCKSLDEIISFNNLYSEKIKSKNVNSSKENIKESIAREIESANSYDALTNIFNQIKIHEKDLKSERGKFYSIFGKYGNTKTWQEIVSSFQRKAFALAENELSSKVQDWGNKVDFSNRNQRKFLADHMQVRYGKFFQEKVSRIFKNSFPSQFGKLLQKKFSTNRLSLTR